MSDVKAIKASVRAGIGKGAARAVRRQGLVPAVIYGGGEPPIAISLDYKQTHQLIYAGHFLTTVFEIDVDGKKVRALPRDFQLDVVKDTPLHVDFLRLSKGQTVSVEIPVHVIGQDVSPGIKNGGVLQIVEHTVELMVPADNIPDSIDISVAELTIGDSIHLSQVKLPANTRPVATDDITLVSIVPPTVEVEPAEEAAPAEGEAAAAEPAKE